MPDLNTVAGMLSNEGQAAYDKALKLAIRRKSRADTAKCTKLLKQASAMGYPGAHYALATWYLQGVGVRKDCAKAVELLKKAAAAGIPDAQYDLAVGYEA